MWTRGSRPSSSGVGRTASYWAGDGTMSQWGVGGTGSKEDQEMGPLLMSFPCQFGGGLGRNVRVL